MDDALHALLGRKAVSRYAQTAVIDDDGIQLITGFKAADLSEELSAALCAKIEGFRYGEEGILLFASKPLELGEVDGL